MDEQAVARAMDDIHTHWPEVGLLIPRNAQPVSRRDTQLFVGFCSHPEQIEHRWLGSIGGLRFTRDRTAPNGFFLVGTQHCHSDDLVLMWSEADRRFWFYDLYGHSYRGDLGRSPARTRARLQEALERWRAASGDVVYVGQAGWYHPEQSRWELIYGRKLD